MAVSGHGITLEDRLARELPESCRFVVHHLSTPPTACPAIYAAPPNEEQEETYCESHFLSISVDSDRSHVQVFAIEVLIYTTEYLTTLFVSKADSTGYLYLLKLPPGTQSPLKILSTTFLQYLKEDRERSDRRLVLSLFARAQNQYLFPGSIENDHKHVLDDRGLIKWWCKVLDPILAENEIHGNALDKEKDMQDGMKSKSHGFLKVPGCDSYETRTFLPREELGRIAEQRRWFTKDPLLELGRSPGLPERCLIPRFPDDPKARFVETLDDEIPDEDSQPSSLSHILASPSKKRNNGRWRSVKSLEQFWEMMQFRQECSSGRLVGFLWATFQPAELCSQRKVIDAQSLNGLSKSTFPTLDSLPEESSLPPPLSLSPSSPTPTVSSSTLQKPVSLEQSPTPTPVERKEATSIQDPPEQTRSYYWPKTSRGEVVLRQKDYQRVGSLLLRLDYADRNIAIDSSSKWISDVAQRAGLKTWGRNVAGTKTTSSTRDSITDAKPAMLNAGLIKKKKRQAEDMDREVARAGPDHEDPGINTLSAGLVRKKAKVAGCVGVVTTEVIQSNGKAELS